MDPWIVMVLSRRIDDITCQTKHPSYSPDQEAHGDALCV